MRYDLEIQPTNMGMIFVEQSKQIPPSSVPIIYTNVNETNVVPADLVELELSSKFKSFTDIPLQQTSDVDFIVQSNKILVTNIARFSKVTGTVIPIFYKHVITMPASGMSIIDQSIKIYNELNIQLDNDLFVIESSVDEIYVYINPIDNSILSIEYGDNDKVYRELVKLQPVFADVGDSWTLPMNELGRYEFVVVDDAGAFRCYTNNPATKFIASKSNFASVLKPVGNINGHWYLRLDNIIMTNPGPSGENIKYQMIEYNLQLMQDSMTDPEYNPFFKKYTDQIAKIVSQRYIQLQSVPSVWTLDDIDILIKDKATSEVIYAFTTNKSSAKMNSAVVGVPWSQVDDYTYNGILKLPISIDETLFNVYATYSVDRNFYEYRTLNLNAIEASHAKMIGIYIIPYDEISDENQVSIYFTFIGHLDERTSNQKYRKNGAGFSTKQEYLDFLSEHSCMNLCYTSISTDNLYQLLDTIYCGTDKEQISNKFEIAKVDLDLFKRDLINNEIQLSVNDVALAYVDQGALSGTPEIDNEYFAFIDDVINKNICASSDVVIANNILNGD